MPYSFASALARSLRSGWVWYSAIMRCLPPANPEPCRRSSFSISDCDNEKAEGVFFALRSVDFFDLLGFGGDVRIQKT